MILRPFETTDIEACAKLHKLSRRESEKGVIFDSDLDRYDLNHFIDNWTTWSGYKETKILVAEDNDTVVGFVMFGKIQTRPDFDKGIVPKYGSEIYALYVHPDHFRKGIGKKLFLSACNDLIQNKQTSLILWTKKKNRRSCAFYDSFGGNKIGKKRVDMGEKSWAEESCFGWLDIRNIT